MKQLLTTQEILYLARIADTLVRANDHRMAGRRHQATVETLYAMELVHQVWGLAPTSPIALVQVWAIQSMLAGIDAADGT